MAGMAEAALVKDLWHNKDIDDYNRKLKKLAHGASVCYARRCLRLAMPEDVPIWYKFFTDNGLYRSDYCPDITLGNTPHVFAEYPKGKRRIMLPEYQLKRRKDERYETWARKQAIYQSKYEEPEYYAMVSSPLHIPRLSGKDMSDTIPKTPISSDSSRMPPTRSSTSVDLTA